MNPEKPYQYSADDIRRYKQGLMTNDEMHAMEKASLDDPFLADAMEGLESASPTMMARDLEQLKSRLSKKIRPHAAASSRPKQWLSMAAAVVLVLGAAIASWYIYQPKAEQQIAQTTEAQQERTSPTPTPPVAAQADSIEKDNIAITKKDQPGAEQAMSEKNRLAQLPPPDDQASSPVAAARSKDSSLKEMAVMNEAKDAAKTEAIVDRLDRSKSEEVVTGYSSKKISRSAPAQAPPSTNTKKDSASGLRIYTEPADGWSAFDVYFRNGLRKPVSPVLHGNVIVRFSVNPENGKLFDFHIDKSLHPLYDKEAIRVLKEGPAWAVYNTEGVVKTSYTVVF